MTLDDIICLFQWKELKRWLYMECKYAPNQIVFQLYIRNFTEVASIN